MQKQIYQKRVTELKQSVTEMLLAFYRKKNIIKKRKIVEKTGKRIMSKSAKIAIISVMVLLAAALSATVVLLVRENQSVTAAMAQVNQNESRVAEANEKIKEYEEQIARQEQESADETAKLQKKLKEAEAAKKKLEEENAALKKEIETLKAQKKAKTQNLVLNKSGNSVGQSAAPDGERICYLTFDDGPSDNTLAILKVLAQYDAKATFFVINSSKLDYVQNIVEAGHSVGLHTASHKYDKIYTGTDAFFADLKKVSDRVEKICGEKSMLIRFPGGSSNLVSKKYSAGIMTKLTGMVTEKGYAYFDWNVDSGDADAANPRVAYIRNHVLNGAKNKNSICVLMHDAKAKTNTVKALPEIIEGLQKMGYTFQALTPESYGYHHHINN